jgi:alcohol dehydrogenase class IV
MQATFEFRAPRLIRVGRGVLAQAPADAARLGISRALLVADAHLAQVGQASRLATLCEQAGIAVVIYGGVDGEPLTRHVEEGLAEYRRVGADGIIALGGGSAMDTAKAVAAMSTNPGLISDYMAPQQLKADRPPLVCIPTTAGTGSEVTRFTIITDPDTSVKMLIADPRLVPDVAVDDPELTDSCPPRVTAAAGLDALTHAIEAYVSRRANPYSRVLALSAIRRIAANLRRAFADGLDQEARDALMLGQLEAGLAFSNSSVCLIHGMARPLGAHFHLTHGLANAILLPAVMAWSHVAAPRDYAEIATALGCPVEGRCDEEAARAGVTAVAELCRELETPTLGDAAGSAKRVREAAAQMAQDALASGSPANNPRVPSAEEIVTLYEEVLAAGEYSR